MFLLPNLFVYLAVELFVRSQFIGGLRYYLVYLCMLNFNGKSLVYFGAEHIETSYYSDRTSKLNDETPTNS